MHKFKRQSQAENKVLSEEEVRKRRKEKKVESFFSNKNIFLAETRVLCFQKKRFRAIIKSQSARKSDAWADGDQNFAKNISSDSDSSCQKTSKTKCLARKLNLILPGNHPKHEVCGRNEIFSLRALFTKRDSDVLSFGLLIPVKLG